MKKNVGILDKVAREVGATATSIRRPGVVKLLRAVLNPGLNADTLAVGRILALLKSNTR